MTAEDLIRQFEGCELKSYRCPAGVWTIGYGHTGPDVSPGMEISQEQAESLLAADVESVRRAITPLVPAMGEGQMAALVSFAFNVGVPAFFGSTLRKLINVGDISGAADQFLRWDKVKKKPLPGLTRRRQAEREVFLV